MKVFVTLLVLPVIWCYMEFVPYEKIERCSGPGKRIEVLDFSKFHIIVESDEDFYLNGSLKFLKEVKAPQRTKLAGERWIRDKWIPGVEKKAEDCCEALKNKLHPSYQILGEQKYCPMSAGVSLLIKL